MFLAVEEKPLWTASLEEEENERLQSLSACINDISRESPTPDQLNALLVAALQGQMTLIRASRVFPDRSSSKRLNVTHALAHGPTAELARRLHHAWQVVGVSDLTLKAILQQAVFAIGTQTREARTALIAEVIPCLRRGVDPKAQAAFAAEGRGQCQIVFLDIRILRGSVHSGLPCSCLTAG